MKPPFWPKKRIERACEALLSDFQERHGVHEIPPVPVEAILEKHLGLTLDFEDLKSLMGKDGVLGATLAQTRQVFVDASLDPDTFPENEGRYNFTIAHEIGHWQLHSSLVGQEEGWVFCRSRSRKDPLEWQADYFAASLLMPEAPLRRAAEDFRRKSRAKIGFEISYLARKFQVSDQAMLIRQIGLGLRS